MIEAAKEFILDKTHRINLKTLRLKKLNNNLQGFLNEELLLREVCPPTTLTGINHTISNLLANDYKNQTDDYKLVLATKLNKFITTLERNFGKK